MPRKMPKTEPQLAYAVFDHELKTIDLRTVGPTPRSAMVNGFWTIFKHKPSIFWTEDFIDQFWLNHMTLTEDRYEVISVTVQYSRNPPQTSQH